MKNQKQHLENLVYFAWVDKDFDQKEKDYIMKVGLRLGLEANEVKKIIETPPISNFVLPDSEVLRYILFDDILNIICADKKITDEENNETIRIAKELGFDTSIADNLLTNLKKHIELGFDENFISNSLKQVSFLLTNNVLKNGNYSL